MENTKRTLREEIMEYHNCGVATQEANNKKSQILERVYKNSIYYYDHKQLSDLAKNGNETALKITNHKSYAKDQRHKLFNVLRILEEFMKEQNSYNLTNYNSGCMFHGISLFSDMTTTPEYDKTKDITHTFIPKTINTIKSNNKDFTALKKDSINGYTVTEYVDGLRCVLLDDMLLDYSMKPIKNEHLNRVFSLIGLYFASEGIILDGKIYKENTPLDTIKDYCNTKDVTSNEYRAKLIKERDNNKKEFINKHNDSSLEQLTTHEQGYKFYITDCYIYDEPELTYNERMQRVSDILIYSKLYTPSYTDYKQQMIELLRAFVVEPCNKESDKANAYIKDQLRRKRKVLFNRNDAPYEITNKIDSFVLDK